MQAQVDPVHQETIKSLLTTPGGIAGNRIAGLPLSVEYN
jgi:hypothetical protein